MEQHLLTAQGRDIKIIKGSIDVGVLQAPR